MTDRHERVLIRRVVDALLREDHLGLNSRGRSVGHGRLWTSDLPAGGGLVLSVRPDGFQADRRLATPRVTLVGAKGDLVLDRLDAILAALAPWGDAEAAAGWATFVDECHQDLASRRWTASAQRDRWQDLGPGLPMGVVGALRAEWLAAHVDHPVYPTARCRFGLDRADLRAYAPELAPRFALRWAAVPKARVVGRLPSWWPTPAQVGLADARGPLAPVHPLAAARVPELAAHLAPREFLQVRPTLSMRTVAVLDDPNVHLKLPIPVATLGVRNRRTIKASTLRDGAVIADVLRAIAAREPAFAGRIRHADESSSGFGDSEYLSWLVRRYPPDLDDAVVLPVAALTARGPDGPLAARLPDGALASYLDLLVDWHVALWLRYGVALEAHQQNVTLVLPPAGPVGLLYKDNDSARVDLPRLRSALGAAAPDAFADSRIAVTQPYQLADLFTTITLHLCAAAPLFALREAGLAVAHPAVALRPRLLAARDRWVKPTDAGSVAAAHLLTERVLDAERLPIKAMLTSGTLLPKARLGCPDVNKYYLRTGPNYLRAGLS